MNRYKWASIHPPSLEEGVSMSKLIAFITAAITAAGVLVPVVAYAYGIEEGPCAVSVTCIGGEVVSCSSAKVCYWKVDSLTHGRGFVECDGSGRTYCGLIE
jgi:hypothetical protein